MEDIIIDGISFSKKALDELLLDIIDLYNIYYFIKEHKTSDDYIKALLRLNIFGFNVRKGTYLDKDLLESIVFRTVILGSKYKVT